MFGSAWLVSILTTLTAFLAIFNAWQLGLQAFRTARHWQKGWIQTSRLVIFDGEAVQAVMHFVMLGMLVPRLQVLPSAVTEGMFLLLSAWYGLHLVDGVRSRGFRALVGGHHLAHLIHCVATVYMVEDVSTGLICGSVASNGISPVLAGIVFWLVGHGIRDVLVAAGSIRAKDAGCIGGSMYICRALTGGVMATMLVTMN